MKRMLVKILAVLWLLIVTPLFGILPLLCLLPFRVISKPACNLEMTFLWEVIGFFGADTPPPGIMDAWPTITPLQLGLMSTTVLALSAWALFLLFSKKGKHRRIAMSQ